MSLEHSPTRGVARSLGHCGDDVSGPVDNEFINSLLNCPTMWDQLRTMGCIFMATHSDELAQNSI